MAENPIKQILLEARPFWDHSGTLAHIRENFLKIIDCGTIALGAEIYASEAESKLVFHTCKSRFCTSCGQRATEEWHRDLETILPDIPYIGITLTIPMEFRAILQQNRHLLHGVPAMGAEAIMQWAKAVGSTFARYRCSTNVWWIPHFRSPSARHGFSRRFA
jgi:hypothetical protein